MAHEHIYWDQASVLVQVGLLDPRACRWRASRRAQGRRHGPVRAEQAEVLDGLDVYPLEVHGLRVGPLGFIGVPLEPFIELGTAIVAGSPFAQTFVSGYTNGYRNYLPTIDQWPRGGYEVDSCAFRPEAATLLVEVLALLAELAD